MKKTVCRFAAFLGFLSVILGVHGDNGTKIAVITDKGEYQAEISEENGWCKGEEIVITIRNQSEKEIFLDKEFIIPFSSFGAEIKKSGNWENCERLHGCAKYPRAYSIRTWLENATKLGPGEEIMVKCLGLDHGKSEKPFKGTYRFSLDFIQELASITPESDKIDFLEFRSANPGNAFQKVFSNEFEVK